MNRVSNVGHSEPTGRVASEVIGEDFCARLLSSSVDLERCLDDAVLRELTYAKIFVDSVGNISPVVVEAGTVATLVINISDSAALQAASPGLPVETWGRYFDRDQSEDRPAPSFADCVRRAAGARALSVGPDLPVARYRALEAAGATTVREGAVEDGIWHVYRKRRADIEAQWTATRDMDAAAVAGFVSTLRRGEDLLRAMNGPAVGFERFDGLLHDAGLTAFLVTSPFNAELFTGLPAAACEQLDLACVFRAGDEAIVVIARRPLERADFEPADRARSFAEAVRAAIGHGAVGFEEGHLAIGRYAVLDAGGSTMREAVAVLRRWQDMRAGADLPYFIVAANGVLHGVAAAERFMARQLPSGLTERDAGAAFDQGVAAFARRVRFEGRVGPYFDIIHSGERTLLPAVAGEYALRDDHATIKFDMGLLVRDAFGCVRGCSDIARTLSPDPAIRRAHDALRASLVDRLIPAMRPGMSGGDIHVAGVDALRDCTGALRDAGLLRPDRPIDGYSRDCGHTIHRTTAGSVYFLPGVRQTIEPGMLGCVEYVWPVGDRIVAVEDAYYVTETDVIPFTI